MAELVGGKWIFGVGILVSGEGIRKKPLWIKLPLQKGILGESRYICDLIRRAGITLLHSCTATEYLSGDRRFHPPDADRGKDKGRLDGVYTHTDCLLMWES